MNVSGDVTDMYGKKVSQDGLIDCIIAAFTETVSFKNTESIDAKPKLMPQKVAINKKIFLNITYSFLNE
jgi:hypothetical protein